MQFYDGGAFADCPYIQYPHGMGTQRAPAAVLAAAAASSSSSRTAPSVSSSPSQPSSSSAAKIQSARVLASVTAPASATAARGAISGSSNNKSSRALTVAVGTSRLVVETAEETTARTAQRLQDTLAAAQASTEVFDGRSLALHSRQRAAATQRAQSASNALTLVVPGGSEDPMSAGSTAPGPIVRSPTKEKKSAFTDALRMQSRRGKAAEEGTSTVTDAPGSSAMVLAVENGSVSNGATPSSAPTSGRSVVVPFCVSSWQNRKKLIVPVEQRLAQQHDARTNGDGGMGDAVLDLAVAMQKAAKDVAAELAAKTQAQAAEEEQQQSALEAAEAEKARKLLEQKAAELAAQSQRSETRDQRRERIRLEREVREQEKVARQQQRMREKAAARLQITVEDLEADEVLLRTVEEASVHAHVPSVPSRGPVGASGQMLSSGRGDPPISSVSHAHAKREVGEDDDDDGTGTGPRRPAVRGGVFASAVISNEGIQREMKALGEAEGTEPVCHHDGIRLREREEASGEEEEEDDGGDFQLHSFAKKKQRL